MQKMFTLFKIYSEEKSNFKDMPKNTIANKKVTDMEKDSRKNHRERR